MNYQIELDEKERVFFSIIIPVYNAEKYIKKCINSILKQEFDSFELILIDDGSTDSSPQICDYYADVDTRIKVIHQNNGGQTKARQAALRYVSGKYIVCVDSDDWIEKKYLHVMWECIIKNNVDVVCCGMTQVIENTYIQLPLPYREGRYTKDQLIDEIYPILIHPANGEGFVPSVWGKAIRSDIYKFCQERVNQKLKMGEDLACSIPCIYAAMSMYILNDCLYYYRSNPMSYTQGKKAFLWEGPLLIAESLSSGIDIQMYDFQDQLYRRIVRELFLVVESQFNRIDSFKEIKREIKEKLKISFYDDAIKNAHFSLSTNKICMRYFFYSLTLKYKQIWLIKLYHIFLNRKCR